MKTTKVVAAIIINDNKVFATQRGYGEFKDGWEFPGGKVEPGEDAEAAIVREIREELDSEIEVEKWLDTMEYDYPKFRLSMDCFICKVISGDLILEEHEAARWRSLMTDIGGHNNHCMTKNERYAYGEKREGAEPLEIIYDGCACH